MDSKTKIWSVKQKSMQRFPGLQFSGSKVLGVAAAATKSYKRQSKLFLLEIVLGRPLLSQNKLTGATERLHSWYNAKLDEHKINS